MEINTSDGLTAWAPVTRVGHWIGRALVEKGRTPPADPDSVTHWDKMRNATTALLSTDCQKCYV